MAFIEHDDCVPVGMITTPRIHTHEGQAGAWVFASEATPRDLERARASGWVPPAERPHPPARPDPDLTRNLIPAAEQAILALEPDSEGA